ncbi:MAG TPA: aminoglycoside phosphotransferase [Pseudohongiella sp.]|nr:aminoglycoside phosphotransferase [Pseudohongiella sp.]
MTTVQEDVDAIQARRQEQLENWARQAMTERDGQDPGPLHARSLSADASFRRYFRCRIHAVARLLVDAPPDREDNPAFVRAAAEFSRAGMRTPEILARNLEQGFLVVEDFGDQLYWPALLEAQRDGDMERVEKLYGQAMLALLDLQADQHESDLPPYDRGRLEQEMRLFDDWFCSEMLNWPISDSERTLLQQTRQLLCDAALQQPQVRVHRDYHSRNLMIPVDAGGVHHEDQPPGVIDFQDAVIGPVSYDLVSLLRDCYVAWPTADVRRWVNGYARLARQRGILPAGYTDADMQRDFDLMGLQRSLKVLGIFCRLALRDGKQRYLADLPLVMHYVVTVASEHAELAAFVDWFRRGPMPAMQQKLRDLGLS